MTGDLGWEVALRTVRGAVACRVPASAQAARQQIWFDRYSGTCAWIPWAREGRSPPQKPLGRVLWLGPARLAGFQNAV